MNKKIINYALTAILVIAFLVYGISSVSAEPIAVDSCRVINQPGEYILTQDITNVQAGCFRITANNVIFDGNGHVISGDRQSPLAKNAFSVTNLNGITIKNTVLSDFAWAIVLNAVTNSRIYNNTISDAFLSTSQQVLSSAAGITLLSVKNVSVDHNLIESTQGKAGIDLYGISRNNVIEYNRLVNNDVAGIRVGHLTSTGGVAFQQDTIIRSNFVSGSKEGITLYASTLNSLINNTLDSNRIGVQIYESNNNLLVGNQYNNNLVNINVTNSLNNVITTNNEVRQNQPFSVPQNNDTPKTISTNDGVEVPSGSQRVVSGSNGSAVGSSASVASVSFLSTASVPMTSKTITANKKPSNNTKKKTIAVSNSNNKPANKVVSTTVTTVSTASKASTKTKTATVSQAQGSSKVIKLVERKKKGSVRNK